MAASAMSTPINTVTRDNLTVLIRNNMLNDSAEFMSECDVSMTETDSPLRKPSLQPVNKKLFHSPMSDQSPNKDVLSRSRVERTRKARKRKQSLVPDSSEKLKKAYVKELEGEGYSPDVYGGMRKKVLISLFHNKEYSMDFS